MAPIGKIKHLLLLVFVSRVAVAGGSAPPSSCVLEASKINVEGLMRTYVPSGSNGRAAAGAVYLTGAQGEILQVIFEKNVNVLQAVASTQKILTAYTAYKRGGLSRRVNFTDSDMFYDQQGNRALFPGSNRQVQVGEALSIEDYMGTMINQSSNGASFAISRGIASSTTAFMKMMNDDSKLLLGSTSQSFFQNPSGLTDSSSEYRFADSLAKQQSSAKELTVLAAKMMAEDSFRNQLESAGVQGAKNGYLTKFGFTKAAGKTMVATFPMVNRCGNQRVAFAFFGSLAGDQFSKFNSLIQNLRERVWKNTQ
jgi:D-alanyl-D-alanine carboxypeptidase